MGLLSPKDLWRGGWEPADKSPCTSLPAQVMFCSWDALRGYWKVGDKGGEGSLAAPCSRWPPSSSSTRAAASAPDPSSQAHRPPLTSPMVAPSKAPGNTTFSPSSLQPWGWQPLHAVSNLWVSSTFPLHFFSLNNILVTNPFNKSPGFEVPGSRCFSDWTLTDTALWPPNWRIIIPCLRLNFFDYWDKLVLYVYWPHVFVNFAYFLYPYFSWVVHLFFCKSFYMSPYFFISSTFSSLSFVSSLCSWYLLTNIFRKFPQLKIIITPLLSSAYVFPLYLKS